MADAMRSPQTEATLLALTKEAQRALGGAREARVTEGSLSFGREGRSPLDAAALPAEAREQRHGEEPQLNDVYLVDDLSGSLHVSRAHFSIERSNGQFFLIDRGSAGGTIVAGVCVGGRRQGGRTELRDGDEVIVGTNKGSSSI